MDFFTTKQFYPRDGVRIKNHYALHFESVYVAFLPFFKVSTECKEFKSVQKTREIDFEEMV